jgi:hypothetical protein
MWINGKALHEIATEALKAELAKQNEQIWINAIIEELQYRDRNPEYHF